MSWRPTWPRSQPVPWSVVLILVRHGRTAHNASRRLLGRLDLPLDQLGERQAAALGAVPELNGADRVVCSPLARARATADALGLPVTVDERWAEVDYGVYDGLPLGEVPPEVWTNFRNDLGWVPEGGESLAALAERVEAACEDLWDQARQRDVVVVTHVSPIKAAITWALGVRREALWRMFVEVASVSRIGSGPDGQPSLRSFNETHHRPSA